MTANMTILCQRFGGPSRTRALMAPPDMRGGGAPPVFGRGGGVVPPGRLIGGGPLSLPPGNGGGMLSPPTGNGGGPPSPDKPPEALNSHGPKDKRPRADRWRKRGSPSYPLAPARAAGRHCIGSGNQRPAEKNRTIEPQNGVGFRRTHLPIEVSGALLRTSPTIARKTGPIRPPEGFIGPMVASS